MEREQRLTFLHRGSAFVLREGYLPSPISVLDLFNLFSSMALGRQLAGL